MSISGTMVTFARRGVRDDAAHVILV